MLNYCKAMYISRRRFGGLLSIFMTVAVLLYAFCVQFTKYLYLGINSNSINDSSITYSAMAISDFISDYIPSLLLILAASLVAYVIFKRRQEMYGDKSYFWNGIAIRNSKRALYMLIFDGAWALILLAITMGAMAIMEQSFGFTNRWTLVNTLHNMALAGLQGIMILALSDLMQHLFKGIRNSIIPTFLIAITIYIVFILLSRIYFASILLGYIVPLVSIPIAVLINGVLMKRYV